MSVYMLFSLHSSYCLCTSPLTNTKRKTSVSNTKRAAEEKNLSVQHKEKDLNVQHKEKTSVSNTKRKTSVSNTKRKTSVSQHKEEDLSVQHKEKTSVSNTKRKTSVSQHRERPCPLAFRYEGKKHLWMDASVWAVDWKVKGGNYGTSHILMPCITWENQDIFNCALTRCYL